MTHPSPLRQLWHDVRKSLAFSIVLVALTVLVEHTAAGEALEHFGYDLLQGRLSQPVNVTVIDISSLAARPGVATPRTTLREAIDAISDQHPRAVGVDIDFAPDAFGYLHPRDPDFFRFCLDTRARKGVPVFLGVARTVLRPPAQWLGNAAFQDLAAHILIPYDSRRMLRDVNAGAAAPSKLPARSMSAALAGAYGRESDRHRLGRFFERLGLVENVSTKLLTKGVTLHEFWVDYGAIDTVPITRTTNPAVLRDESQRERLEDRIVLIGDASGAADRFSVRGRDYPGILLHACAVDTLVAGPLFVMTAAGRLVLDAFCIVFVLVTMSLVRSYYRRTAKHGLAVNRVAVALTALLLAAPLAAGVLFVRETRILWTDFLLGATVLLLHPALEHRLAHAWHAVKQIAPRWFTRFVFDHGKRA